jgi:hypothetical protein
MNLQRLLVALTVVNLVLLAFLLAQTQAANAETAPVLRGRALEIVDEHGRVRAGIQVLPASKSDGKAYAETVILRLIDPNGRPPVKLTASTSGAALLLMGETDDTYARLMGPDSTLTLIRRGTSRDLKP